MSSPRTKLEQNIGWIILALLLFGCLLVLLPFVSTLIWGVVLSVSLWPAYRRLLRLTGNRRNVAALTVTLGVVLVVVLPFLIVGLTLGENVSELSAATRKWLAAGPPAPPAWLERIPAVGPKAAEAWQSVANNTGELLDKFKDYIQPVSAWLLRVGLALGSGLLQLVLSILVAFFLLRGGARAVERLGAAVDRIAGTRGKRLLELAGKTVRGVVYGILGTALVQAILAGIGFVVAGVPGAALLALLTFFSSVVPVVGTALVWLPASLWLFHQGSNGWGIFMLIWGFGVSNVDNVVKPWLISQGSDLPFVLIFMGVIGGALSFGFIGVFLGPTLLALGWRLVEEWMAAGAPTPATEPAPVANSTPGRQTQPVE
jgi:predicted PurR-regulated permease PerM